MGILNRQLVPLTVGGTNIWTFNTDNTLAQVTATGWLSENMSGLNVSFDDNSVAMVTTTDYGTLFMQINVSSNGQVATLANPYGMSGEGVLSIANGGTNSSTALANGLLMTSVDGAIKEISQDTSIGGFNLTDSGAPVNAGDLVNKSYTDDILRTFSTKKVCLVATTGPLPDAFYDNGVLGAGATLTADANGAFPDIDNVALSVGDRLLVTVSFNDIIHGIWVVTNLGSAGSKWVLTRATDFDTVSTMPLGSNVLIASGASNGGSTWVLDGPVSVVGSDPIIFVKVYSAA